MRTKLLRDVIALAAESYPLPVFSDEPAVTAWVGKLAEGITGIVYDAIKSDPAAVMGCCYAEAPYTVAEVDEAAAALPLGKIGDGSIIKFLQSVNWAQLIQTVITIISVIPKTPAPATT